MKFDIKRDMHNPGHGTDGDVRPLAKVCAAKGLGVIPCRGKVPACANGVHDATTDPAKIDKWPANIDGYAAAVPDGVVVVDIDPRNGGDKWLRDNAEKIPETSVVFTGGGGWHIWFTAEPGLRYPSKLLDADGKSQGVDFRQWGNYVLMPGSMHESGRPYAWYRSLNKNPAPVPDFVEEHARRRGEKLLSAGDASPHVDADSRLTEAQIGEAAELLATNMIDGAKHVACRAFGGWANSREIPWCDTELIVRLALEQRSDVKSVDQGVASAQWAYTYGVTAGWAELRDSLDDFEVVGPKLESVVPEATATMADKLRAKLEAKKAAAEVVAEVTTANAEDLYELIGRRIDLNQPVPDEEFAIEGLPFQMGVVNGLVGYAGAGKSPLVATLVASWATDTDWLGHTVAPGPVFVVCFEAIETMARNLRRAMAVYGGVTPAVELFQAKPGSLHDPGHIAAIRRAAELGKFRHLVFDTYGSGATGRESNDTGFADPLKELEIPGVNTLALLHSKKGQGALTLESIAGSGAVAGAVKGAVGIQKPDPASDTLTLSWMRGGEWFPDRYFRFKNIERDGVTRWGLYVDNCDAPKEAGGEAKETQHQMRDRFVMVIKTTIVPRMKGDASYRPTLAELAADLRATGAKETDILKKEITGLMRSGVLDSNKVDGVLRFFPL